MVSDNVANGYLQLGVAGATLLILLVFVILLFRLITKINQSGDGTQINKMDKLCDKIDDLITSNAKHTEKLNEVLLCNDKDQKETLKLLGTILDINMDMQKRVVRIDDRTYACLSPKQGSQEG